MPLYSYRCSSCQKEFDEQKSIAERSTATCECGSVANQYITPVAHSLGGSGRAKDGYGSAPYWPTGQDYREGRVSAADMNNLPVVGPDGKLRDNTGSVIAG